MNTDLIALAGLKDVWIFIRLVDKEKTKKDSLGP